MEGNDFLNDGIEEKAKNFEKLLISGESFFYDTDDLEDIIEYYLDFEEINKASKAIAYAISIYPFEIFYQIKKAEVAMAKKDVKAAIKILDAARSIEPNNAEIAKVLGDCYSIILQHKRAIDCYLFALNQEYETEEMLLRLARIHFLINNPKKAMSYLNAIPSDYIFDEFSLQEFIKLFFDFSQFDKCVEFLDRIIEEDPYNFPAWYFLGMTYQKLEDYPKAINAFEFCIAIDDTNTMGHLGKGNSLMEMELYEEAIESYKLSLDNDDSDADVLCNIAECYENLDNYSSAKYFYLKAIRTDKYLSDAFFGLAVVYKKMNNLKDAEKNLLKAIDLDSFESVYHIELAEIYLINENKERCNYHYQQAYDIDPETTEIVLDFSHALVEFDDVQEAVLLLQEHLVNFKDDHRVLYRIASYQFILGLFESGFQYLHAGLQMKPTEYFLLYEYAPFTENIENVSNIIDLYTQRTNDKS
jgi:tetratricopeptide (TPR) repeat protein